MTASITAPRYVRPTLPEKRPLWVEVPNVPSIQAELLARKWRTRR